MYSMVQVSLYINHGAITAVSVREPLTSFQILFLQRGKYVVLVIC